MSSWSDPIVEDRDYTYVQAFMERRDGEQYGRCITFLVGTHRKREAQARAEAYIAERVDGEVKRIVLYPRNYVMQARAMAAEGRADWLPWSAPVRDEDTALADLLG